MPLHWDDATSTLTIDARQGSFESMPKRMTFNVVLVSPNAGIGPQQTSTVKPVAYTGQSLHIPLRSNAAETK